MDLMSNPEARAIVEKVQSEFKAEAAKIEAAFKADNVKLAEGLQRQEAEIQKFGAVVSDQSDLKARQASFDQKMADLRGEFTEGAKKLEERLSEAISEIEKRSQRLDQSASNDEALSIGERVVKSEEFKAYSQGNKFRGQMTPVTIGTIEPQLNERMLIKALTEGNMRGVLSSTRLMEIMRMPVRNKRIKDLFNVYPTQNLTIEFVREKTFGDTAAPVSESGVKPQASIEFETKSVPVTTIAHWLPVTNQLLADVRGLQAYLERRLIEGLKLKEDVQILYGSGDAPNLTGILSDPGIQTYNWSAGVLGDTKLDAIRRSITLARNAEFDVDAVIVNPNDWEDMELTKDDENRYIWNTAPGNLAPPTVWRVPVIDTTAIEEGDFLTGAFDMGAAIWDREDADVRVTDTHADFFIYNKTVILVEERLGVTVFRPRSFVYGTFDNAPIS